MLYSTYFPAAEIIDKQFIVFHGFAVGLGLHCSMYLLQVVELMPAFVTTFRNKKKASGSFGNVAKPLFDSYN